jgi:O-antigen ligase
METLTLKNKLISNKGVVKRDFLINLLDDDKKGILVHIILVFILSSFAINTLFFYIVFLIYSLNRITKYKNKDKWVEISTAYFVGNELFHKILQTPFLAQETNKYFIIIILLVGMQYKSIKSYTPLIYLLLLLPSAILIDFSDLNRARKLFLLNMSGPIALFAIAQFFENNEYNSKDLNRIFKAIVLPIISTFVIILLKTGGFSNIDFGGQSEHGATAGYAPNQVSTAFGFGFFIIIIGFFINNKVFKSNFLNLLFAFIFLFQGFITFSRGGIISPIIAVILTIPTFIIAFGASKKFLNLILIIFLGTILVISSFVVIDNLSNNLLSRRYLKTIGQDPNLVNDDNNEVKLEISGRGDIANDEIQMFIDNPIFGVGPGNAILERKKQGITIQSHTEQSRILAEHGILGLIALLIIIFKPFQLYFYANKYTKIIIISFFLFAMQTWFHSQMRSALHAFTYGIIFINYKPDEENELED